MIPENPKELFTKLFFSQITAHIEYMMQQRWRYLKEHEMPKAIQEFMKEHPAEISQKWEDDLLKSSLDIPIEDLKWYVENMPPAHFCRAELRGVLKERLGAK